MAKFLEFEAVTSERILINLDLLAMVTSNIEGDDLSILHLSLPAEQTFVRVAVKGTYAAIRKRIIAKNDIRSDP